MKTLKDLNKKLISKKSGYNYTYKINNTTFKIDEFNNQKGWCLNEFLHCDILNSYGHNGLTLKDCKEMILMAWNENRIR